MYTYYHASEGVQEVLAATGFSRITEWSKTYAKRDGFLEEHVILIAQK